MRKSSRMTIALVAALGLVTAACGDDETSSSESSLIAGVAFDTGGRGDGTFNDSAGVGADKAAADLGIEVKELEATVDEDRKANLELLVEGGAKAIVGVGFMFTDPMNEIAAANPDVTFGIVDSVVDQPNVKSLVFAEEQGSFLVGAAAALKCGCDKIGFIGGQEIDLIKKFEAGYTAGAKQINPDIVVEVKYLGPAGDNSAWGNVAGAKEIAAGWYADGVEVIYTAAGGSGAGTIEAAIEAGKWAIGVDSDQYLTAGSPEAQAVILTSMLKRVDVAVYETIKAVAEGDTAGGIKVFDLSVDGVGYATSGDYLTEFIEQLEALKADIIAGTIKVPTAP
ncbi:MAG: BMP family lipoprotein [Ilumatobacteraceae bacterium]|jgi:basic membrane protein A